MRVHYLNRCIDSEVRLEFYSGRYLPWLQFGKLFRKNPFGNFRPLCCFLGSTVAWIDVHDSESCKPDATSHFQKPKICLKWTFRLLRRWHTSWWSTWSMLALYNQPKHRTEVSSTGLCETSANIFLSTSKVKLQLTKTVIDYLEMNYGWQNQIGAGISTTRSW